VVVVNSTHVKVVVFFVVALKVQNVDYDGLFGNIGSVIDLSERLFQELQDTDSIGEETFPPAEIPSPSWSLDGI